MIEKLRITPGPWVNDSGHHVQTDVIMQRDAKHICIAPPDFDSTIADFDLIAAAPEMLENMILYCLDAETTAGLNNLNSSEMIQFDEFISIIEKATGLSWEEVKKIIGGGET